MPDTSFITAPRHQLGPIACDACRAAIALGDLYYATYASIEKFDGMSVQSNYMEAMRIVCLACAPHDMKQKADKALAKSAEVDKEAAKSTKEFFAAIRMK
jgi:hypothetical protein